VAHLQIRPLLWDDEGWPLAGPSYDGTPPGPPPANPSLAGLWSYRTGDGPLYDMELRDDSSVVSCRGAGEGTWSYAAPMLTIDWTSAPGAGARTDRSILSADGRSLVGRTGGEQIVRAYLPPTSG